MQQQSKMTLEEVGYVKRVTLGSVNPNQPLSEQAAEAQACLLNRCLKEYPRGIIIGKDVTIARFQTGPHEFTMEKITYHVGFRRKPAWEEDENG